MGKGAEYILTISCIIDNQNIYFFILKFPSKTEKKMYLNFVSLRSKSLFKALLLLSTCVLEETIIFETYPKYYILWSINQTYHFCQDIYFIHILLSLSCGDILSNGLKKKKTTWNNEAVDIVTIITFSFCSCFSCCCCC